MAGYDKAKSYLVTLIGRRNSKHFQCSVFFVSLPPEPTGNTALFPSSPHSAHAWLQVLQGRYRDGQPWGPLANVSVSRGAGGSKGLSLSTAEQTPPTQGAHSLIRNNHSKEEWNKQLIVYRGPKQIRAPPVPWAMGVCSCLPPFFIFPLKSKGTVSWG